MSDLLSQDEIKEKVGRYAAEFISSGMTFGLGTGTTVNALITELGIRVREGLIISIVPTSESTKNLAEKAGIGITDLDEFGRLPLTIDGADQIDLNGTLIKGGGGALLDEKIVAGASDELIIIADNSKYVNQLGKFPLPVEVIPFGYSHVRQKIQDWLTHPIVTLRMKGDQPYITDHRHWILDCHIENIDNPLSLDQYLKRIPGLVETGLFIGMAGRAVIGHEDGSIEVLSFK